MRLMEVRFGLPPVTCSPIEQNINDDVQKGIQDFAKSPKETFHWPGTAFQ